ncbi:ankyrin repeat domain-containing protein [Paenibacillus sp. NPDC058071]|uniref:ankyrin repeat domain-containing protein n=1 Tax=Paenibacillus sp. NPDC058071 TaxID=3346326 RepID=UPI0036DF7787
MNKKLIIVISIVLFVIAAITFIYSERIKDNRKKAELDHQSQLLYTAVSEGDLVRVKQITQDVGIINDAIFEAIFNGHVDIVEYFLNNGVDPNKKYQPDDQFESSLLSLAVGEYNIEIAKLLIAAGADVNYKDRFNNSVFLWAAYEQYNSVEMLKLLVEHGADWKIKNVYNESAYDILLRFKDSNRIDDEEKLIYIEELMGVTPLK